MKREIPLIITFIAGTAFVVSYFVPHPPFNRVEDTFNDWFAIIAAFAIWLGALNLMRISALKVSRRKENWYLGLIIIVGFVVTVAVGLYDGLMGLQNTPPTSFRDAGTGFDWIYRNIFTPLSSTMFAMLAFYTVHTPIQPSKRHVDYYTAKAQELPDLGDDSHVRERRAWVKQRQDDDAYASMVAALDENIGRLLDALDAQGLSDNTILVFTSDNGGLSAFEGRNGRSRRATSNLPLRAGKGWLYEGGIRVPLLVRAPGVNEPGARSGAPVTSADLAPTLLDLAGIDAADAGFDGMSLRPVLDGGDDLDREAIYFHYPHYHASGSVPSAAIRAGDWKLIHFFETGSSELYRLSEDIGERSDRAAALPDKTAALEQRLLGWLASVDAPMPVANRPLRLIGLPSHTLRLLHQFCPDLKRCFLE